MRTQNNARQSVRNKWVTGVLIFVLILCIGTGAMLFSGCGRKEKEIDGTATATAAKNTSIVDIAPTSDEFPDGGYVYITSNLDSNVKTVAAPMFDYDMWSVDKVKIVDTVRPAQYILVRVEGMENLSDDSGTRDYYILVGGDTVTIKYIYAIALPTAPVKEGYTFKGWFTDEACTQPYSGSTVEADITLYAGWTINKYSVTFVHNNGVADTVQTKNYKETATTVTPADKEGHTFKGWFTDKACTIPYNFSSEIKGNITLYAGWDLKTYTVTFMVDGEVYQTLTVTHGTVLGEDTASAKLLRMFNVTEDEGGTRYFSGAITEELVLYGALTNNAKKWLAFGDWFDRVGLWICIAVGVVLVIVAVVLIVKKVRGKKR